jgi:hypothetical protein
MSDMVSVRSWTTTAVTVVARVVRKRSFILIAEELDGKWDYRSVGIYIHTDPTSYGLFLMW